VATGAAASVGCRGTAAPLCFSLCGPQIFVTRPPLIKACCIAKAGLLLVALLAVSAAANTQWLCGATKLLRAVPARPAPAPTAVVVETTTSSSSSIGCVPPLLLLLTAQPAAAAAVAMVVGAKTTSSSSPPVCTSKTLLLLPEPVIAATGL
jgi:hypothetical protein